MSFPVKSISVKQRYGIPFPNSTGPSLYDFKLTKGYPFMLLLVEIVEIANQSKKVLIYKISK